MRLFVLILFALVAVLALAGTAPACGGYGNVTVVGAATYGDPCGTVAAVPPVVTVQRWAVRVEAPVAYAAPSLAYVGYRPPVVAVERFASLRRAFFAPRVVRQRAVFVR